MSQIFVIKTARDCGHCAKFKAQSLEGVKSAMTAGGYRVVHIDLPTMNSPMPSGSPPALKEITTWFPSFIFVSESSWNDGTLKDARVFPMNQQPTIPNFLAFGANKPPSHVAQPTVMPTAGTRCGGPKFRGHQS